jgi:rRNA maturation endonuclease Nob1
MRKIDEDKLSTGKYGAKTKQDFPDPIVRCDSCHVIVHRRHIRKVGCCPSCGNRRFRNVLTLREDEMKKLVEDGVDSEFLAVFEGVALD